MHIFSFVSHTRYSFHMEKKNELISACIRLHQPKIEANHIMVRRET